MNVNIGILRVEIRVRCPSRIRPLLLDRYPVTIQSLDDLARATSSYVSILQT